MLFVGLSLLLYPTISDYWNSFHQSRAIAGYAERVAKLDEVDYQKMLNDAKEYNTRLHSKLNRWVLSDDEKKEYENILNVSGTGIIGYVEIPEISVSLPIYHGTDEGVLQVAVGHIEGSSFPIGGEGNHSVISGHRGLPSAKLFTNLDKLSEGDDFVVRVLNETYTYEVDRILIVKPNDLSGLDFEAGKDYCTLVTCTPYGINSHRLLVRGHRVENAKDANGVKVTADANQIDPMIVAPVVAVPMLLILFIIMMISTKKRK
jgi:sortase A